MKSFVSVAMLAYNHEKFLEEAINSVIDQRTSFEIELLIGEDGSTDATLEIAKKYADKYPEIIKVISSGNNIGAHQNIKRVLESCSGKYIASCEGDDYWTDPYKLEKQVHVLENHPDYGWIHCNCDNYFQSTNELSRNVLDRFNTNNLQGNIYDCLLEYNFIHTTTVMARKGILMKCFRTLESFDRTWLMEDKPLWLLMAREHKVAFLPESVGVYRIHEKSAASHFNERKQLVFMESSFDVNFFFIQKFGCLESTKRIVEDNYHNFLGRYGFVLMNKERAKKALLYFKEHNNLTYKNLLYYFGSLNPLFKVISRILLRISRFKFSETEKNSRAN